MLINRLFIGFMGLASRMRVATSPALPLVAVLAVLTTQPVQAQTFTVLHKFAGRDGAYPFNTLIQGTDGNLYGTTSDGGAGYAPRGTFFKITPSGTLTTLYTFCSRANCADGAQPSGVVEGGDGNFYGTTINGGPGNWGTVFKITPGGVLTSLHTFGNGLGGLLPLAGLIQGTDGNFYGTTTVGGATGQENWGVVFKITRTGAFTILHSFLWSDGAYPEASLLQATDGNLYGTTEWTLFKITTNGTLTTLYTFCAQTNCSDGNGLMGGALIQGPDGNLYGVTPWGGSNSVDCLYGCGTIFKITLSGALTTLYSFCSQPGCTDGAQPYAGLVQGTDGSFYGTTTIGGPNSDGTAFKITADGTFTTLHDFCSEAGCPDGKTLDAGLIQHTNGKFYGAADLGGGRASAGTVFSLSVGLKAFVATQPTFGKVGAAVTILGTNLTGATSVRFNGTPATFTVVSGSEIKTTVPTGATNGLVEVLTSSGKILSSNVSFQVTP